jgi:hypothetical protein
MTWRLDPPTEKQLRFLRHLGCPITPRSKGEACDLIAARVPKPRKPDPAEIIDKACERAMRRLANGEGHYQEMDGVLIPPRAPLSTSTGRL